MNLNQNERLVLKFLSDGIHDDGWCYPFAPIVEETKLDRKTVRRACRSLARRGLAEYKRGLWSYDGEPAGAGYCITDAGQKLALTPTERKEKVKP